MLCFCTGVPGRHGQLREARQVLGPRTERGGPEGGDVPFLPQRVPAAHAGDPQDPGPPRGAAQGHRAPVQLPFLLVVSTVRYSNRPRIEYATCEISHKVHNFSEKCSPRKKSKNIIFGRDKGKIYFLFCVHSFVRDCFPFKIWGDSAVPFLYCFGPVWVSWLEHPVRLKFNVVCSSLLMVYEGCEWEMTPRRHSVPTSSTDKQRRCSQDFLINDESGYKYQIMMIGMEPVDRGILGIWAKQSRTGNECVIDVLAGTHDSSDNSRSAGCCYDADASNSSMDFMMSPRDGDAEGDDDVSQDSHQRGFGEAAARGAKNSSSFFPISEDTMFLDTPPSSQPRGEYCRVLRLSARHVCLELKIRLRVACTDNGTLCSCPQICRARCRAPGCFTAAGWETSARRRRTAQRTCPRTWSYRWRWAAHWAPSVCARSCTTTRTCPRARPPRRRTRTRMRMRSCRRPPLTWTRGCGPACRPRTACPSLTAYRSRMRPPSRSDWTAWHRRLPTPTRTTCLPFEWTSEWLTSRTPRSAPGAARAPCLPGRWLAPARAPTPAPTAALCTTGRTAASSRGWTACVASSWRSYARTRKPSLSWARPNGDVAWSQVLTWISFPVIQLRFFVATSKTVIHNIAVTYGGFKGILWTNPGLHESSETV